MLILLKNVRYSIISDITLKGVGQCLKKNTGAAAKNL